MNELGGGSSEATLLPRARPLFGDASDASGYERCTGCATFLTTSSLCNLARWALEGLDAIYSLCVATPMNVTIAYNEGAIPIILSYVTEIGRETAMAMDMRMILLPRL